MITQQCNRCKKKDTYPSGGKPSLFASERESFCKSCNAGWVTIETTMHETFSNNLNTRRDKYFRLEGDTP